MYYHGLPAAFSGQGIFPLLFKRAAEDGGIGAGAM